MSTKYILLTKSLSSSTSEKEDNQILYLGNRVTYLMPSSNHVYYAEHGLFESALIDWSKQFCNPSSLFLDIGAHTGSYAISLAPYAKAVYAYEPQRMTYYALCGGVALSGAHNIHCFQYGLGSPSQVGSAQLYIVSDDGGGSTVQTPANNMKIKAIETIELKTLDSLNIQENISFMKIDVEENELSVLQGARETIQRNNMHILFEQNTTPNKAIDYLCNELGYYVVPVNGTYNMYLATKRT